MLQETRQLSHWIHLKILRKNVEKKCWLKTQKNKQKAIQISHGSNMKLTKI